MTKRQVGFALVGILFIVFQVFFDLTMPDYMSEITLLVETAGSAMSDILIAGAKMLGCAFGSLVSAVITVICSSKLALEFSGELRHKVFKKVSQFSMGEMSKFSTSSLITRTTNDIQQVQMLIVFGFMMLLKAPIMAVWAIVKISGKQFEWTLATGITVVLVLCVVLLILKITIPYFKRMQKLIDSLNLVVRENLSGLSVVHAYNAENYQIDKFEVANKNLTDNQMFAQRSMAFLMPSIQLSMNALTLCVFWIGGVLIANAGLADQLVIFSDMMVFSQYAIQVIMSFMMLVMIFMLWPRASVAANRINEVLDTETSINDGDFEEPNISSKDEETKSDNAILEFKDVTFKYPDAELDVLTNVSFKAQKGQTIAIIGSTGSGKSTLVNLIPRFFDVTDGKIVLDGVDIRSYKLHDLRDKISYIPQRATLFEGTIRSNIDFGDNAKGKMDDSEILRSIETAQAADFVSKDDDGIDKSVAQGGSNFSGGQKQRLSIARGLARDPEIIIFDDTFSALDYATDKKLRSALEETCADATKIIVAQRIGTIRNADLIVVLDEGSVAGLGTHSELMESCEVYKQIALSQLSQAELE